MKKIFIGSSTESLGIARKIKKILNQLGVEANVWEDDVFGTSNYTLEDLKKATKEHSGAIFIFSCDDKLAESDINENDKFVTRDNVILEAGMFINALGQKAVAIYKNGDVEIPSDLRGITYIASASNVKIKIKRWLDENVKNHKRLPEKNVFLSNRGEIHKMFPIEERLHIKGNNYKNIKCIRMMNFANAFFLSPDCVERKTLNGRTGLSFVESINKILDETNTQIDIIIQEPTENVFSEFESKIANTTLGKKSNVLLESLKGAESLKNNSNYNGKFFFHTTKNIMPFGIFNIEFNNGFEENNYIQIDLYSDKLTSEDDRRSFFIFEEENKEQYNFFKNNFDSIKTDTSICKKPSLDEIKKWIEELENNTI